MSLKKINQNLIYHCFIHKSDSEMFCNDEKKTEVYNEIKDSVGQDYDLKGINIEFHLTTYLV